MWQFSPTADEYTEQQLSGWWWWWWWWWTISSIWRWQWWSGLWSIGMMKIIIMITFIYSFLAALWLINRLPFTPLHPLHPSLNFLDFETRAPVGAKKYDGCSDDDVCAELGSPICFGVGTMLRYQGKSPTLLRWNRFDWEFINFKIKRSHMISVRLQGNKSRGSKLRRVWLGDKQSESFQVLWALNHSSAHAAHCYIWTTHIFARSDEFHLFLPIIFNSAQDE